MELKRDEIIKALENCLTLEYGVACKGCPLSYKDERRMDCLELLMKNALSLIKELTEENEKLLDEFKSSPLTPSEYESLYRAKCWECEALRKTAEQTLEQLRADINRFADKKGLVLTIDGITGYFPKEFIIEAIRTHASVIRCKDCQWWTKQPGSVNGKCALLRHYPMGDWQCAIGKRKDEV